MSTIVKTVTRWVMGFVFLYGLYVVAYGHVSPGGGFAGGVILASAFVLLLMAFGRERTAQVLPYAAAGRLDSIGAMTFWAMAILGIVAGGELFLNVLSVRRAHPEQAIRLFDAGIIPLCNVAIALKVCASLVVAAVLLAAVRVVGGGSDEDFTSEEA